MTHTVLNPSRPAAILRRLATGALSACALALTAPALAATDPQLPGQGVTA